MLVFRAKVELVCLVDGKLAIHSPYDEVFAEFLDHVKP